MIKIKDKKIKLILSGITALLVIFTVSVMLYSPQPDTDFAMNNIVTDNRQQIDEQIQKPVSINAPDIKIQSTTKAPVYTQNTHDIESVKNRLTKLEKLVKSIQETKSSAFSTKTTQVSDNQSAEVEHLKKQLARQKKLIASQNKELEFLRKNRKANKLLIKKLRNNMQNRKTRQVREQNIVKTDFSGYLLLGMSSNMAVIQTNTEQIQQIRVGSVLEDTRVIKLDGSKRQVIMANGAIINSK